MMFNKYQGVALFGPTQRGKLFAVRVRKGLENEKRIENTSR